VESVKPVTQTKNIGRGSGFRKRGRMKSRLFLTKATSWMKKESGQGNEGREKTG